MDLTDIGLFSLAEKRLAWVDRRQELLAQNVANADTPGWQAKDLPPFAATLSQAAAASQPVRTNPLHLPGSGGALQPDRRALPEERAPDGNAVSLEEELTKVADTDNTQELVTDLYKMYLNLFHTALGGSS
jgi:flagellar basal-body rod protein FlgB